MGLLDVEAEVKSAAKWFPHGGIIQPSWPEKTDVPPDPSPEERVPRPKRSATQDPRLREGFVTVNEIPQRHAKRCKASGKVRWLTEADVRGAVRNLGDTGSYYRCGSCACWHVTSGPFAEVVPGVNDGDAADLTLREAIGGRSSILRTKRRTDARLKYAIAAGELAWRWIDHLLNGADEPDAPLDDVRELLDRAQGPWDGDRG